MASVSLVCIIDDDELVRSSIRDLIHASGLRAATFSTSEEFLASQERGECDCVVADIQMPGLTGIELMTRLAAEGSHTPVIIITGDPQDYWREHAKRSGAAGFLYKPFEGRRLMQLVEKSMAA